MNMKFFSLIFHRKMVGTKSSKLHENRKKNQCLYQAKIFTGYLGLNFTQDVKSPGFRPAQFSRY